MGNEFVDDADVKLDHVGAVEVSSISINSDLYILLAALEVESLLVLHKRHLAENGRNARIPIVIQEIFNDSNNLLLPDSCKDFNVAATAEKHSKPLDMSSRQISGSSGSRKSFFSPALLQVPYLYKSCDYLVLFGNLPYFRAVFSARRCSMLSLFRYAFC